MDALSYKLATYEKKMIIRKGLLKFFLAESQIDFVEYSQQRHVNHIFFVIFYSQASIMSIKSNSNGLDSGLVHFRGSDLRKSLTPQNSSLFLKKP